MEQIKGQILQISRYPHNTYCCDCGDRDALFVNITIGSFVCRSCCKILIGLNPPHCIKSLEDSQFTRSELEIISMNGNALVNLIYLLRIPEKLIGKEFFTNKSKKDFLKTKYVKKEWKMKDPHGIKMAYACSNQRQNEKGLKCNPTDRYDICGRIIDEK
uniref:Arf-GAP domain and FG repeat-containing protein 1 (Trinotate prediction) n=1 Tax=Henneguya salminicola TaxID=69463 RepID=A0A6G3MIC1_HENSL